jgi:hypothetical protein
VSKYKGTAKPPGDRSASLRGEASGLSSSVKGPSSPSDLTSSDEESSSEEESDDEEEEMPLADISTVSQNPFMSEATLSAFVIVAILPMFPRGNPLYK